MFTTGALKNFQTMHLDLSLSQKMVVYKITTILIRF